MGDLDAAIAWLTTTHAGTVAADRLNVILAALSELEDERSEALDYATRVNKQRLDLDADVARLTGERDEALAELAEVIEALAAVHVQLDEVEEERRFWQDRTNQYGGSDA